MTWWRRVTDRYRAPGLAWTTCLVASVLALAALAAAALAVASEAPRTLVLAFRLPAAATTSAGLFDAQGRLLRTLWSGEPMAAGSHRRELALPAEAGAGELHARLIHHDIRAHWEGVVGNSSAEFTGASVHRAFLVPAGLAAAGRRIYYATGYNEFEPGLHAFDADAPQRVAMRPESVDPFAGLAMVATDGRSVVAASIGGLSRRTFVVGFDAADGRRKAWPEGSALCLNRLPGGVFCHGGQDYRGVLDLSADAEDPPTGLAMQARGPLLAVARARQGSVTLYDKASGRRLASLAAPLAPDRLNQIAFAPGGDLWVLTRDAALRYTDPAGRARVAARIDGLIAPLAVAVHPGDDDAVWIAQGGALQQLHRFDREGRRLAQIGRLGGYADGDPRVSDDRLCFLLTGTREQTALAVQDDGSVWVVDTCNNRLRRVAADGRVTDHVAYVPGSYAAAADAADTTRVFANFLEFQVDPATPLAPGAGRLVRNWLPGLPAGLRDGDTANRAFPGLRAVVTLPGGRTVGWVGSANREALVELPASGPMRMLRMLAPAGAGATRKVLQENGDLVWSVTSAGRQAVMRQRLLGVDDAGDPTWAREPERLASVPTRPGSPHDRGAFAGVAGPRFPVTSGGRVIFFDPSIKGNEGFHLGAAMLGGDEWLWMASPSAPLDGRGSFQTLQADRLVRAADRGIQYGGNVVLAHGPHVLYGFHGEFYTDQGNGKVGQANQFMHFHDSGLFIGQFGVPSTRATGPAQAGVSGNAFSPALVAQGGRLFLYHNDESAHAGVHRWRIDGLASLRELAGQGRAGAVIELR